MPDAIIYFNRPVWECLSDGLKEYAESKVSDNQLKQAKHRFPVNSPATKEGYLFRDIFHRHYPQEMAAKTVPGGVRRDMIYESETQMTISARLNVEQTQKRA